MVLAHEDGVDGIRITIHISNNGTHLGDFGVEGVFGVFADFGVFGVLTDSSNVALFGVFGVSTSGCSKSKAFFGRGVPLVGVLFATSFVIGVRGLKDIPYFLVLLLTVLGMR